MGIFRKIQFKRNQIPANSALEAKEKIKNLPASALTDGEIVIGTYSTTSNADLNAKVIGVKADGKVFNIDNQTILDVIGIDDNGNPNDRLTGDTILKDIDAIEGDIEAINGEIVDLHEEISQISGSSEDFNDRINELSGKVDTFGDELDTLSGVVSTYDERIDEVSGTVQTFDDRITAAEQGVATMSGDVATVKSNVNALSYTVSVLDGKVTAVEGKVDTVSGKVDTVASDVASVSGRVDTLEEEMAEISGITSDDIYELSGKSITTVEDSSTVDLTIDDAADGTKKVSADVKVSTESGNVITIKNDGLFTQVDYNAVTNALVVNGVEKQLNGGSVIDSIIYDSATEELVITYHDSVGETHTIRVPMKDLIEEYEFASGATADYNVAFNVVRDASGSTTVQADVAVFDCGEYD